MTLAEAIESYLTHKKRRLAPLSHKMYERTLRRFREMYPDTELAEFEPPEGAALIEAYLDHPEWAAVTFNRNLVIFRDFFGFHTDRKRLDMNPTVLIERARKPQARRTTFTPAERHKLIASQPEVRDRVALRLLVDYGIRKGALQNCKIEHFDAPRKRLTIFTKGSSVQEVPIPDPEFWRELDTHIAKDAALPHHFLLSRQKPTPRVGWRRYPELGLSGHGMHKWWYRCLARAGLVEKGVEKGTKMHVARHTAGQRVLDATGNLKAVQMLLGHASISTTADCYVGWDANQLS